MKINIIKVKMLAKKYGMTVGTRKQMPGVIFLKYKGDVWVLEEDGYDIDKLCAVWDKEEVENKIKDILGGINGY